MPETQELLAKLQIADTMSQAQDLLANLRIAREVKKLSYQDIVDITEENHEAVSIASVKRVFAQGARIEDFRYEQTIRPIIRAVLGMDEEVIIPAPDEPHAEEVATIETLKALADYKADMLRLREVEHQRVVAHLKDQIAQLHNDVAWYRKIVVVLGVISLCALIGIIADLAIGTTGWIRY